MRLKIENIPPLYQKGSTDICLIYTIEGSSKEPDFLQCVVDSGPSCM